MRFERRNCGTENEALFVGRKSRGMGDTEKLLVDQFLTLFSYVAEQERKKIGKRQA
ncbi:hypothetical protein ACQKFG_23395 [Peribacillus sp. NPDC076916]|uniref:hypothetical protein n=1 Tax=Peribacillus sp. NPDC076916 TaxID=3390608 RepID=UPI003CFD7E35